MYGRLDAEKSAAGTGPVTEKYRGSKDGGPISRPAREWSDGAAQAYAMFLI
jgi:hypothetical protein